MSEEISKSLQPQASLASEPLIQKRLGYWADHELHPYFRLSVENWVEEFCGWSALKELIDYIPDETQKAFFVTMFLTGGRVSEVLQFRKSNFEVRTKDRVIKVSQMRLLKRYRKVGEAYLDAQGHRHWHTVKELGAVRKTFAFKRSEIFAKILEKHLSQIPDPDGLLFPSPSFHHRDFNRAHGLPLRTKPLKKGEKVEKVQHPYTRHWAYWVIREVNKSLPKTLKVKLGLNKVWYDKKTGKKIADELHLWLHWFRSMRASQLHTDWGFNEMDLMNYFDWKDGKTAFRYAHSGWRDLTDKMKVKT